jgi:hypothetical protein
MNEEINYNTRLSGRVEIISKEIIEQGGAGLIPSGNVVGFVPDSNSGFIYPSNFDYGEEKEQYKD